MCCFSVKETMAITCYKMTHRQAQHMLAQHLSFGMCWLIQIDTQTNITCISVHCALLSTVRIIVEQSYVL